jgi:amino acid adenylation domain-containing protein
MLLHDSLLCNGSIISEKIAIYHDDREYRYENVIDDSVNISRWILSKGLNKGDRVILLLENSYDFIIALYGCLASGFIVVPINPKLRKEKIDYIVKDTDPSLIISSIEKREQLKEKNPDLEIVSIKDGFEKLNTNHCPERIIDADIAAILYTSGSTGMPKGVTLTHLNMVTALKSIDEYLGNRPSDVILNLLPFSFDYGLYQIFLSFFCGGSLVIHNDVVYLSEIIKIIRRRKVTALPIVPAIGNILLRIHPRPEDLESLRYITNTAQSLPIKTIKGLHEILPQVKIFSMYGLTECKRICYLDPDKIEEKPGSVGGPIPNVEIFLVDDNGERILEPDTPGELVVRGSNLMLGYWNDEKETKSKLKDGYYPMEKVLFTGDLFRYDKDGDLYFLSRIDDMFKVGGEKVYPVEIESALEEHERVEKAVVINDVDWIMGNSIIAIVTSNGSINIDELMTYLRERLEDRLIPREIKFVDSMPINANKKVDRRKLEKNFRSGIDQ